VGTSLAYHFIGVFPTEVMLDGLLLLGPFDGSFQSVHEHVKELFNIHLLKHVGGISVPVLERVAEAFGADVLLF